MDYDSITPEQLRDLLNTGRTSGLWRQIIRWLDRTLVRRVASLRVRWGTSRAELDDILQDVLTCLAERDCAKLRAWRGHGPLRAYVCGFVYPTANAIDRKETRRERCRGDVDPTHLPLVGADSLRIAQDHKQVLIERYGEQRFELLCNRLTDLQKQVLFRFLRGESPAQISTELGKSRDHIYQILHEIRRILAELDGDDPEGDEP